MRNANVRNDLKLTSQIAIMFAMLIAAFASKCFFVWALSTGTQNLCPLCGVRLRAHKDHFGGALINHNSKRFTEPTKMSLLVYIFSKRNKIKTVGSLTSEEEKTENSEY